MSSQSPTRCVSCEKVLTLFIEPDEEDDDAPMEGSGDAAEGSYVDDDVHLQCGCHFHWQCLLDSYSTTECPNCGRDLTSSSMSGLQQILCNLKNEGGLQEQLDIMPLLTEEMYLKAYPEERRCQAFLEFCGEGDVQAIADLLNDDDGSDNEVISGSVGAEKDVDVLRYQDQIRTMNSALHVAIQNRQERVAWLLLLLASGMEESQFPTVLLGYAEGMGFRRGDQTGKIDIRSLRDGEGLTAEQRAVAMGGMWEEWIRSGRLKPPT